MKSVGIKLTLIMLCTFVIGILITVGVSLSITGSVIMRESLTKVDYNTEREAFRLDSWLGLQDANMNTLAVIVARAGTLDKEELRPLLKAVIDDNGLYSDVYMGFPDNTAVMGSGFAIEELYDTWKATERSWYKLALTDTSRAHITAPYVDTITGELCVTVAHAVMSKGAVIGVVGADILITEIKNMIMNINLDHTGYAMLLDKNGDILVHPADYAPAADGTFVNISTADNGSLSGLWSQISAADGVYTGASSGVKQYFTSTTVPSSGWHLVTVEPVSVVTKPITNVILIVIPIVIIIMALAALFIFTTIKKAVSTPLSSIATLMRKASTTGDLSLDPEDIKNISLLSQREDELGELSNGTAAFIGQVTDVGDALKSVSNGDLTISVNLLSDKDDMGMSLKTMTDTLNNIFSEINLSANQVSDGSKQIADGAQSLAQGTNEQAAAVQQLSNSIAEIAQRTRNNAETAEKTSLLSETIKESAEKGSRQMEEMTLAVKEINEASQSIGKVIKTIDDIAFQTNILALNAAVEAARAGEYGKGFAVVAEEVRHLAAKSAEAAKETGDMIQNTMEKAELGSHIAEETASSFSEIVTGINKSSMLVSEIAEASEEQSQGMEQLNIGMEQVSQVVQQNSETAEVSAAASEELSGQSDILKGLISHFKLK